MRADWFVSVAIALLLLAPHGSVLAQGDDAGEDDGKQQRVSRWDLKDFDVVSAARDAGTVFMLGDLSESDERSDVIVWSLWTHRVKAHYTVEGTPEEMVYSEAHNSLYFGYEFLDTLDPVQVTRINLDGEAPAEKPFITLDTPFDEYCGLAVAGQYLSVCSRWGGLTAPQSQQFIVDADGNVVDDAQGPPAGGWTFNPHNNAIYYIFEGTYSSQVSYRHLDSDGTLTESDISAFAGDGHAPTLALSASGEKLVTASGLILNAQDLTEVQPRETGTWEPPQAAGDLAWRGDSGVLAVTEGNRLWFWKVADDADSNRWPTEARDRSVDGQIAAVYSAGPFALVVGNTASPFPVRYLTKPRESAPRLYCPSAARSDTSAWIAQVAPDAEGIPTSDSGPGQDLGNQIDGSLSVRINFQDTRLQFRPGFETPEDQQPLYWGIWLDTNRDGRLDEQLHQGQHDGAFSLAMDVPASANSGATRMRVVARTDAPPEPCGFYAEGETENYEVDLSWQ